MSVNSQLVVEMRIAVFFQAAFIQARIFAHLITTSLMWKSTELNAVLTQSFIDKQIYMYCWIL